MGYSEASSPICLGISFRQCVYCKTASSCAQGKSSVTFTDFLPVARAYQPEESLRAFMDPLADAVSCATKWLKSGRENFARYHRIAKGASGIQEMVRSHTKQLL